MHWNSPSNLDATEAWLCAIGRPTFFHSQTVVSMKGILEVRTDARVWQSSVDMRFDLRCSTFVRTASVANATAPTAAATVASSVASSTGSSKGGNKLAIKSWEQQISQRQQSEGVW